MKRLMFLGVVAVLIVAGRAGNAVACEPDRDHGGHWLAADFHQHTLYTDGSTPFDYVMSRNNMFGLDWWANSEHGGAFTTDGNGVFWDNTAVHPSGTINGDVLMSGGHQVMYRWQSLRDFAWQDILRTREIYRTKRILSGLEWNVPGHEHCSTGIVARDASAISAFEFMFDKTDNDTSRIGEVTPYGVLAKVNGNVYTGPGKFTGKPYPDRHADATAACAWMQAQMDHGNIDNGWIVFAHVERAGSWSSARGGGYNVEHFRDFNNAGPDVCFGFEGAPGHQVEPFRGFGNTVTCDATGACTSKDFGGTYGGAGYYTGKVGGLWDALLGEGRHWWNFASSDYHDHWTRGSSDFYPGEYQKDWVFVKNSDPARFSYNEIADALRSGKSFFVMGDLVDALVFTASQNHVEAGMGETLVARTGKRAGLVTITIKYRSPAFNNHGAKPIVDHVDLISGNVTGLIDPSSPDYTKPTNDSAKVIASFKASDFTTDAQGFHTVQVRVDLQKPAYFRLRGTNLACGTPNETGPATALPSADYCSPLPDALAGPNTAEKAFADLWFYSNPIFVHVD